MIFQFLINAMNNAAVDNLITSSKRLDDGCWRSLRHSTNPLDRASVRRNERWKRPQFPFFPGKLLQQKKNCTGQTPIYSLSCQAACHQQLEHAFHVVHLHFIHYSPPSPSPIKELINSTDNDVITMTTFQQPHPYICYFIIFWSTSSWLPPVQAKPMPSLSYCAVYNWSVTHCATSTGWTVHYRVHWAWSSLSDEMRSFQTLIFLFLISLKN